MSKLEKHIFMIGFMGVGQTSTSRVLSRKVGLREIYTDVMIEEQEKRSISDIFDKEGEEYFRTKETELIDQIGEMKPCIVSCGGGMAMRKVNVEKMKKIGQVVWLTATPETIYLHVKDSTNRPLLNGNMNVPYIKSLMDAREPKYRKAADIIIETDGCTPTQVADKIIQKVR